MRPTQTMPTKSLSQNTKSSKYQTSVGDGGRPKNRRATRALHPQIISSCYKRREANEQHALGPFFTFSSSFLFFLWVNTTISPVTSALYFADKNPFDTLNYFFYVTVMAHDGFGSNVMP